MEEFESSDAIDVVGNKIYNLNVEYNSQLVVETEGFKPVLSLIEEEREDATTVRFSVNCQASTRYASINCDSIDEDKVVVMLGTTKVENLQISTERNIVTISGLGVGDGYNNYQVYLDYGAIKDAALNESDMTNIVSLDNRGINYLSATASKGSNSGVDVTITVTINFNREIEFIGDVAEVNYKFGGVSKDPITLSIDGNYIK